jgi:lysozyme
MTLLKGDLLPCENFVNSIKEIDTQGKFDALVDFAFNLGIEALRKSTLLKLILAKAEESDIKNQFLRWNKAGGRVLSGLVKRRNWEAMRYSQKG